MNLSFAIPTALDYFGALVDSDRDFTLFEAAVSLGQDEYPTLDVQTVLGEMDLLLARLKKRLPADAGPVQKLRILNQFFYGDLGFGGNLNDFYDPDNSYVHRVLATRRGIPVALAVLLRGALGADWSWGLAGVAVATEAISIMVLALLLLFYC